MFKTLTRPCALIALALFLGLVAIGTAWGFQLIGGYAPCALCLEQRVPYYIGLPLMALALAVALKGGKARSVLVPLLLAITAVLVYGAGLGVYQSGAEWGFWPGPADCGGGVAPPASVNNLLSALKTTRVVSCTEASLRVLGLSFAGWNVVAASAMSLLTLMAALNAARKA